MGKTNCSGSSDQGVMGGLVSLESFVDRFDRPNPALLGFMVASYDVSTLPLASSSMESLTCYILKIGCLLGALLAFVRGDKYGRRWCIIYSCIAVLVGAALQTSAYSRAQYIGRWNGPIP